MGWNFQSTLTRAFSLIPSVQEHLNEALSPQSRCQRPRPNAGQSTVGTGRALHTWKTLRSLKHPCLEQRKMLATAITAGRGCHPACIVSRRERILTSPTWLQNLTAWLCTADGLEQGCQTRCWTAWGSQTHSVSLTLPPGKDGHLGEVTSTAAAHLSTPWWKTCTLILPWNGDGLRGHDSSFGWEAMIFFFFF